MEQALRQHEETFSDLIKGRKDMDRSTIPILNYIDKSISKARASGKTVTGNHVLRDMRDGFVLLLGDVAAEEAARVASGLFSILEARIDARSRRVTRQKGNHGQETLKRKLIGSTAFAHAITVYLQHKYNLASLQEAFLRQLSARGKKFWTVDVDLECLTVLEARCFGSKNMVWGLDEGPHQDGWDPYKAAQSTG